MANLLVLTTGACDLLGPVPQPLALDEDVLDEPPLGACGMTARSWLSNIKLISSIRAFFLAWRSENSHADQSFSSSMVKTCCKRST